MIRRRFTALPLVHTICVLSTCVSTAGAAVVVSTMSSTIHDTSSSSFHGGIFTAVQFATDNNDYEFTAALATLRMFDAGTVNATLHHDNAGLPGSVAVTMNNLALSTGEQIASFVPSSPFTLAANTTYHLALNSPNSSLAAWAHVLQGTFTVTGPGSAPDEFENMDSFNPWAGFPGGLLFEIQGTVPEPSSAVLTGIAAMGIALVRRRSRVSVARCHCC
jgi:hypothetical protein